MARLSSIGDCMTGPAVEVLTVGHSTMAYEQFLDVLRHASVNAIADVRTAPYSRHFPQFNRPTLQAELRRDHIAYVFLGEELGGRPNDPRLFHQGVADYEKMAATDLFAKGLARVVAGARKYRIAMMCSEQDPLDCHRCLLVGRALHERGAAVKHVLTSGRIASQKDIEATLLHLAGKSEADLYQPADERLAAAYRDRASKVAFADCRLDSENTANVER
jgi:uncharacterized protein (DUF488 family)